jgi:glycosyltransferase involved in cell wall biosynthesis
MGERASDGDNDLRGRSGARGAASVVIPAHNEEAVIARLLSSLTDGLDGAALDVVVACNGCTDRTAEVAREHGARVVDVPVPSKIAALNAADALAQGFPRFYVDADVVLTGRAVLDVARALEEPGALAAAPPARLDTADRPWTIRAFYRVWEAVQAANHMPAGSGVYAMSAAGRARFHRFPDVLADDLFARNVFSREERRAPATDAVVVEAPHTLGALLRRRTRVYAGNAQVAADPELSRLPGGREPRTPWWRVVARRPALVPAATVFVAVNGVAKLRARGLRRGGRPVAWGRDDTTRTPAGPRS